MAQKSDNKAAQTDAKTAARFFGAAGLKRYILKNEKN